MLVHREALRLEKKGDAAGHALERRNPAASLFGGNMKEFIVELIVGGIEIFIEAFATALAFFVGIGLCMGLVAVAIVWLGK